VRSDSEARMPAISPQHIYKLQENLLGHSKKSGWQPTDFVTRLQGLSGRPRPSGTVWHLILVSGDVVLLLILLGVLLVSHQASQVAARTHTLSLREVRLIWLYLALVSWGLAVGMTQSHKLNYASNRFKGPCCTLFALLLTCIFWMPLSYFLLEIHAIALARLELVFLGLAIPAFTVWRFLFAEIVHLPRFRQRAVIVGANVAGEIVARELQAAKHSRINVLGYIDENHAPQEAIDRERYAVLDADGHNQAAQVEQSYQNDLSVIGGAKVLRYLVQKNLIDMVIIALEYGANPDLFKTATDAAQLGIPVIPMAVAYENSTGKIPVDHVGDQWYIVLQTEHILSLSYLCWKQALDLACGILGLLILCFVFPIIALLIYLDSPGPIFYSQERVGLRGKPFRIYKFRTMRPDAEREGQAIWAAASDSRITEVGRFLRATHIDELPQLFNILRGDMSLIGPRPERATFISELEKTIPFYSYRLVVKPGLTGWAQVKYHYGRTGNDALIKLQYDLYYVKRQSFMLDLFIIIKTVAEVLSLRGA
jgi:lipopolysaccharide/colanic/teichoic acid biosynthesis glycosyltransferase